MIVCLLSISAVSAETVNDTSTQINNHDSSLMDESADKNLLSVSSNEGEIQENADEGTFTAFEELLTVNENDYSIDEKIGIYGYSNIKINTPDVIKYYKGPERLYVTLEDQYNQPIANAEVKITINNQPYTKITDNNGMASMAINLNSGEYRVTSEYGGAKTYSTVNVKDTVLANDFSKIYKNGTQYYGTFVDSQGNLIRNRNVEININGILYIRKTNDLGVACMNINLNPGEYILTATNPLSGEQHTTKVTVLPSIIDNYDLTKYYKSQSKYTLRIIGDNGRPVGEGVEVKLNINGVFYTRTTDASGYMNMNINLPPGTYTVTAEYNGLRASNTINVLSVLETKDLSMKYHDGSKFEAKILDGQGRACAGQTVTFNINGVFYEKVTGDDGVARLSINLPAGDYIITSTFNGLNAANNVYIAPDYNSNSNSNSGMDSYIDYNDESNSDSNTNTNTNTNDDEIFYINLPYQDKIEMTFQKGKYKVKVYEWRVPPYCELDIILFDINDKQISKFDYDTYYYHEGAWHDMPVNEWGSNYHKWHFAPDVHITQVAVKLKDASWY